MSVAVAPNVTYRVYRWTSWKAVVTVKGIIRPQYDDDGLQYTIWGYDGPEVHVCQIWKGDVPYSVLSAYTQAQNDTDRQDFETNYKASYNQSLEPRSADGVPQITVVNGPAEPVNITVVPATIPTGATRVSMPVYDSISGDIDTTFIIPNGATLIVQGLVGGCEFKSQGSAVELWYDPNGNGVEMSIIDVIHVNGSSEQHSIYVSYVGNGTRKIRMRRRAYGGGTREVFGRWEGYY